MNESLMVGDGENVAFIMRHPDPSKPKAECAYALKKPLITKVELSMASSLSDAIRTMDIYGKEPRTPIKVNIEFLVLPENMTAIESDKGDIINGIKMDLTKNMSVADLFLAINRKLKKRKI